MTTITSRISGAAGVDATKRVAIHGVIPTAFFDLWGGTWGGTWGHTWSAITPADAASPEISATQRIGAAPSASVTRRVSLG